MDNKFYYSNNQNNDTAPPMYVPPLQHLQADNRQRDFHNFNVPSNFSIMASQGASSKILQIDNRIVGFSQYIFFLWLLMVISLFGMFSSMFVLNNFNLDETKSDYSILYDNKTFEILNFFTNLAHAILYAFSIRAFTGQNADANKKAEYMLAGLIASNFIFFFLFIFLAHVSFYTWCVDIFFFFINGILYFQCQELTALFDEKDKLKKFDL